LKKIYFSIPSCIVKYIIRIIVEICYRYFMNIKGGKMASVNKVILIGNLGRDPELRRTPSGTSVASFSIATTEKFNDRSGNRQEKTEWHNIVVWDKLADLANQYLKKGRPVYLEGRLQTSSWDDKNGGGKKYKTEVVATTMQFLGGRDDSQGNNSGYQSAQSTAPQNSGGFSDAPPPANDSQFGMDDDLPF
jgi:single-strand DNA-binding protein